MGFRIFFVPISSSSTSEVSVFTTITNRLIHFYDVKPLAPWALDERHFRETAETTPKDGRYTDNDAKAPISVKILQTLTISNDPKFTYFVITERTALAHSQPNAPASANTGHESIVKAPMIMPVAAGPDCEALLFVFRTRMQPLWEKYANLVVNSGQTYEVEDFKIRVGEVRAGAGGAAQAKAVLVEVEWSCDEEDDAETAEVVLGAFWKELKVTNARQQSVKVVGNRIHDRIGQWCEALRLH